MSLLRIGIASFAVAICVQLGFGCSTAKDISYRLLDLNRRQFSDVIGVHYAISVDRFLARPQIEQLLCQVLRDHEPSPYSFLTITVYYNLDKMLVLPFEDNKFSAHVVATYGWNISLPDNRPRLVIWRDVQGNYLDHLQLYDFDHTKACKQHDDPEIGK